MKKNFEVLPKTHFIALIPVAEPLKRDFYAEMCRLERWSGRALRSPIDSMSLPQTRRIGARQQLTFSG